MESSMTFVLRTEYPDIVSFLLEEQKLAPHTTQKTIVSLVVAYPDDTLYREIIGFVSHAIGCGLLTGYQCHRK